MDQGTNSNGTFQVDNLRTVKLFTKICGKVSGERGIAMYTGASSYRVKLLYLGLKGKRRFGSWTLENVLAWRGS